MLRHREALQWQISLVASSTKPNQQPKERKTSRRGEKLRRMRLELLHVNGDVMNYKNSF